MLSLKETSKNFSVSPKSRDDLPTSLAACGNALRSHRESYQSTCDSQARSRCCFNRKNVQRKLPGDINNREPICMATSVSFPTRLLFQSHFFTVFLNPGAHQITWGAFKNINSCALQSQRLPPVILIHVFGWKHTRRSQTQLTIRITEEAVKFRFLGSLRQKFLFSVAGLRPRNLYFFKFPN